MHQSYVEQYVSVCGKQLSCINSYCLFIFCLSSNFIVKAFLLKCYVNLTVFVFDLSVHCSVLDLSQ